MDANTSNITPILPTEGMDGTAAASVAAAASAYAQFALQAAALVPGQDGQLVLPSGVSLDNIRVVGRDLVIRMPDGSEVVVPDGAVFVPQFVVDGVAVPPVNLAALLIGQEPQPAAGPPQSSGGNFSQTPGDIGDPFGLGDLLPPTELAFPEPEQRELVPGLIDRDPDVNIQDGGPAGKDVTDNVSEVGLPGTRTNGNVESPGTSAGNGSDSTTGTIIVTSPDGIASITINGVVYSGAGQQIATSNGVLTLGALTGDQIPYTYRLTDNTSGDNATDVFTVVLTDPDGDSSTARLTIVIADDVPTARNDTDSVAGGTYGPETGNVLSGTGTTSGTAGADTLGADGAAVSGFRAGTEGTFAAVGTTINGQYGALTLGANGAYTYVRNTNTPGGVTDVFSYRLTDGDGDTSNATLTINIGDAPNRITFIPEIGDGTQVREPHLPARDGEPSGSQFDGNSEATSGTITFNSPDGVGSVKVSGVTLTPGSLPQTVSSDATGTLVITAYSYDPVTGVGSITYTYTLNDNTLNTAGSTVTFPVVVTDLDGDAASDDLNINIIDDAPLAANDSGTQASENAAITVNVFANDTPGADGVNLSTGVALVAGSLSGAGSVTYAGNGNFTYTPAPGEEGIVTFQYTITDGDGDPSTATVTITLLKDSEPQVDVSGENFVDEAGLPARGSEPAGSNADSDSETTSGTIAVSTGGDTLQSLVIDGVNVIAGGTVIGAHGTLTVTVSAGAYSYSYTLTDNTAGEGTTDSFNVVVTDSDGDSANDNLVIGIHDDAPRAIGDNDSVAAGEYGPATGNVITDAEDDGGKDIQGADGAVVTAVSGIADGVVGGSTSGLYGVLTLNSDGSYSYTRNPGTPGGVSDSFKYTITDSDGDPADAILTIDIGDSKTSLDLPTKGEAGTEVDEAGLATGSAATTNGEFANGTIAYTAPDGPATVTIDGVAVTAVGQTFTGSFGTLTITSIAAGTIGYEYELTTNTSGDATFDDFAVVVTDQDGDNTPGTLVIDIVDDKPFAEADEDSVKEDGPTVADGNVITGVNVADANATDGVADTQGADGAIVTGVVFGTVAGPVSGNVGSNVSGTYGFLTIAADGTYSYTLNNEDARVQGLDGDDSLTETFTYTITDGDGDPSTTTVIITINGNDDPITINGLNVEGPDQIVDEDDLPVRGTEPAGSDTTPETLIKTGSFTVTGVDGIASVKIEGNEATVGQTITTSYGKFTITSISAPADGSSTAITIGYSYELTDNTAHPNANGENFITEFFNVAVTDTDGSTDTDQVEVRIIDDVPDAIDDSDVIAGGSNAPATGNVITDNDPGDAGDIDVGKDVQGADGVTVTAITGFRGAGAVGGTTIGQYGVLTLNADGSYSYVRNDGSPGNVEDVFIYTITDGDGDTDKATLKIIIEDDRPVVGENPTVLVDDDSLGGNPASMTGDDADPQNDAGFLSGSGGDGALTWAFDTSVAPAGFQFVPSGTDVLVQQDQGGSWVTVATVKLVASTGAYTVTLNDNVIHPDGNDENNLSIDLNYSVTDIDLDAAPGILTINFDDDAPTATAEPAQSVGEGGTINGAVDFVEGADGASVTHVNDIALVFGLDGFSQSINIGDGSIKVTADGTYVFTANNPVIGTGAANATFRITDGDKDTATATAAFSITDVNKPSGGATLAALDDDGIGGNAASTVDDLAVPDVDGDGNEATYKGTLTHNFGMDGAGTVSFAALNGMPGTVGTEAVTYAWSEAAGVGTLTATGPRGLLFTLEVTLSTGAYELTLNDNVLHADGPNQENAIDPTTLLAYVVTDADGSTADGTLTITFDDDAPTLSVSGPTTVVEGNSTVGGTWSQTIGADLEGATTVVEFGGVEYALGAAIDTGKGTLTVDANGTWVFTALNNLDNDPEPSISFTVRATDADGDVAEDIQTITISDGPPAQNADPITLELNEAALDTAGATGSNPSLTTETDNAPSLSFTAGSDALTSFQFSTNLTSLVSNLDGAGTDIVWVRAADGQSIVGHLGNAAGPVAVTLTLSAPASIAAGATGAVTVTATLLDNLSHSDALANQIQSLGSVLVEARDHDGDLATGQVFINVQDDVPTANDDTDSIDEDQATATGNLLSGAGTTNIPDSDDVRGADAAVVTGAVKGNVAGPVPDGGLGGGLVGDYGTLTLSADGEYSYALNNADPDVQALGVGDTATEYFTYTITDTDGDKSTATLTITINGTNDLPSFDAVIASVSEEGFGNANPDDDFAPDDTTNDLTVTGSIHLADIDVTDDLTVTLGLPTGAVAADGVALTWVLSLDGKTLTGSAGATPIMEISIDNDGNYTVNLLQAIDHLTANGENVTTFTIPVSVYDGTATVTNNTGLTVRVEDDSPIAALDSNDGIEGAVITGEVLSNDEFGADGPVTTTPTGGVVGVRKANGDTTTPVTTGVGVQIDGEHGKLTLLADGTYIYDGDPDAITTNTTDVFVYTISDADGDLSTTTLTINLTAVNLIADNDTVTVNEAGIDLVDDAGPDTTGGIVEGSTPTANSDVAQGTLVVAGVTNGFVLTSPSGGAYGTLVLNSNGSYTYTLTKPFDTLPDANNSTNVEAGKDVFTYTATDANGNSINGTITVDIIDDVPTATATAVPGAVAALDETATSSTAATLGASNIGDDPDVASSGRISFMTTAGAVVTAGGVYGADGANAVDPLIYNLVVTNAASGLFVTDSASITLFKEGNLVVGRVDSGTFVGKAAFAIAINPTTGVVTVEQYLSLDHPSNPNPDDTVFLAAGSLGVTVTRTDGDGDKTTSTAADISGQISFDDDGPTAVAPSSISLLNQAGAPALASLDPDLLDNYGADGGTPRFSPTLNGTNSGMTSSLTPIIYTVSPDGLSLIGKAGATTIFTITLLPETNQYSVDMDAVVDSLTTINFASGAYQFVGGNTGWVGFVPNGQNTTTNTIDDNSKDLMITPQIGGVNAGTINGSSVALGVGSGNAVDPGEMIRLDFVTDLTGDTAGPGGYSVAGNRDHVFDGHYVTNGASALITATAGSTVRFTAKDDFDADQIVGDGTIDPITKIVIAYDGVSSHAGLGSPFIVPTTTPTNYLINGVTFTVTLNADGSVSVAGVEGTSGAGAIGTQVAVYTADGYSSLEIAHQADANFKLGNFGTVVQNTNPVNFTVPVEVIDGDGDVSASANIAITLNAAAPPVALDLDGDGVEFLSTVAGVAFDFDGDGTAEQTAWVGADDGLLAIDSNANSLVDNGSEIVFGGNGLTDLQGLAANYDSNKDGVLDANDAAFAKFGVWQDANSNGVTDAGEYQSLTDAGIASINLVSDGVEYAAANGDVTVHGTSSYTKADGTTGDVADASFATSGETKVAANENGQRVQASASAGMASSMVAAGLVAAVAIEHDAIDAVLSNVGNFDINNRADAFATLQPASFEATQTGDFLSSANLANDFASNFSDNAIKSSSFDRMADIDSFQNDSFGADRVEALASNLLAPTELDHGMFNMSNGSSFGMAVDAGSQALIALQDGGFAQSALQDVVADALAGGVGQGANVDALLNALAGPANEMSLLGDSLAQTFGDQPVFEALSFNNSNDMFDQIATTQMELSAATGHHG